MMKKFFIAICGIFVVGGAFGVIDDYYADPKEKSEYKSNWQVGGSYTTSIPDFKLAGDYKDRTGTHGSNQDGAIVAAIARDIYQNGGYFCLTQIQASHRDGRRYIWLDYLEPLNGSKCVTMCKPGFYGTNCNSTTPQGCDKKNYKQWFTDNVKLKTNGGYDVDNYTKEMVVFDYQNQRASDEKQAKHVILGIIGYQDHGIEVAPVTVIGERTTTGGGMKSWIESAKSNNQPTTLCAEGYTLSGTTCVEASWCNENEQLNRLCPEYTRTEYTESIHVLKESNDVGGETCYQIRCLDGYGFKSTNNKDCVQCEGGALAYIKSDGTCGKCQKGQIANANHDGCDSAELTKYTRDQMKSNGNRQCWLETDGRKFAGCVKGCPRSGQSGDCWDEGNNRCKVCD